MSLSSAAVAQPLHCLPLASCRRRRWRIARSSSLPLVAVISSGQERIASALLQRSGGRPVHLLLHGGARGADRAIGRAAQQLGWRVQALAADWRRHGRAAGPIRNRLLLEQALVKAQPHLPGIQRFGAGDRLPGGAGTASLVQQARRCSSRSPVPVVVMEVPPPFSPEPLAA